MTIKHLIAFTLCAACYHSAQAQIGLQRNDLAIGFNAGAALNTVMFDPNIKQNMHQGITGGMTIRYICEKYFNTVCAVQAEVNYTQLGWKENIEYSNDTFERTINYVQVPLLTRLGWGRERRGAMFYFLAGPQVGFCLSESDKRGGEWSEQTLSTRPNHVTAQYDLKTENKFDYGITAGLGLEINTAIGHFGLDGRYYYGLGDMFGNSKKDFFSRSANSTIAIKLTYLMDLIKTKDDTIK